MLYSSVPTPKIYQTKPAFNKSILFKPKGWTDSVQSYINEARKLKTLILWTS